MVQRFAAEENDPFCLNPAAGAELLAGAPWRRYAVIGDSLSAGTGDPTLGYANQGWPDRVAGTLRRARPELEYLNTAKAGATTPQVLETQAARMADFAPDLLHLPCGGNDIVRRRPDYDQIEAMLRWLYHLAAGTKAQLVTFTLGRAYVVPAFPDWHERVVRVNEIVRLVAAEYGAVVVDMWNHPVNARDNLLSADRIHFSTSGQAVMAAEVVRALGGLLGREPR